MNAMLTEVIGKDATIREPTGRDAGPCSTKGEFPRTAHCGVGRVSVPSVRV